MDFNSSKRFCFQSVRGCIVDGNLAVLAMSVVKKGEADIPGLTDNNVPRR